ncbi:MAG: DUF1800 domain-containing protein [Methylotetracoccus sp.]
MSISRRELLRGTGVAAAIAAFPTISRAALGEPTETAAPRLERRKLAALGPVPRPPIAVVALNRLTYGMAPGDVEAFEALGATGTSRMRAWVDRQLAYSDIDDSACDARVAALRLTTLGKPLERLWQEHFLDGHGNQTLRMRPASDVRTLIWTRAVYSQRQLFEVIVGFWRNHFSVNAWTSPLFSILPAFEFGVLRPHAFGNFRAFLEAVATSTTMIFSLNNDTNQAGGPNENWARELFELYGMGAENYLGVRDPNGVPKDDDGNPLGYVDNDVYEATRCFTGWRVSNSKADPTIGNTGEFYYSRPWHDRFNKLVLGRYLQADQADMKDGRDALDLIARHPATARFIARKLCRYLVTDDPPETLVDAAARTFRHAQNDDDQLLQVVRTIVLKAEFQRAWGGKLKDPFRATTAMLRALKAEWKYTDTFGRSFDAMGMPLLGRPTPDGYPDRKESWLGSTSMLYRWRICNALIERKIPSTTIDLNAQMPPGLNTANAIVDFWIKRLLGRDLHPRENREAVVTVLAQGANPDLPMTAEQIGERLPGTVAVILMSPDFQLS